MSEELQNVATEVVAEAPAQAQAPVDKKKYFKHKNKKKVIDKSKQMLYNNMDNRCESTKNINEV